MKLRVLGASGSNLPGFGMTSFLLDQTVLIDTGAAASRLNFEEQKKIETVFLSHLHIDHSLGLLLMADNLAGCSQKPVRIASLPEVLQGLRQHLFNNQVWPDFTAIPDRKQAVYRLCPLWENRAVSIGKYTVKAVKVSHSVPTAGFIISDGKSSLLYTADTRPTERIWQEAKKVKDLKAVLIETSFPNRLQNLADVSGHLTPKTLAGEIAKSGLKVPFYVFHIKALFAKEIRQEIAALKNSRIKLAREGARYTF
ncbi:MAG: 3',5'-cyclic-nucleotide phosphodiesterase [Deltaproteobacteria bacterium]|nr:3',5'-cyclic-nucleotide phosphodiesterase [Deltaproteobacteria bacterium]